MDILVRLFDKVISLGVAGPRSTLDAVIEHIWRGEPLKGKFARIYDILERLEKALDLSLANNSSSRHIHLLFRLYNFMHFIANKTGDTQRAQELIEKKNRIKSEITLSPEHFPLVLDSQLYEIDTAENALLLIDSLNLAKEHHSLIRLYKTCWDLLFEDRAGQDFDCSRINIKAEMTLLRSRILAGAPDGFDHVLNSISLLKKVPLDSIDEKRLLNYEILAYVKRRHFSKAISLGFKTIKSDPDSFVVQHVLRAVVSGLLEDHEKYNEDGKRLLALVSSYTPPRNGHPAELIWRDLGMLDYLITNKKAIVLKCLKKGRNHLSKMSQNTPIVKWLSILADMHVDFVKERHTSVEKTLELKNLISECGTTALPSMGKLPENQKELLTFFRHASPY